eukprot:6172438-Pleurochrysis_carterae.AAC.4
MEGPIQPGHHEEILRDSSTGKYGARMSWRSEQDTTATSGTGYDGQKVVQDDDIHVGEGTDGRDQWTKDCRSGTA